MSNTFLLIKCIALGALSFPTPFLLYFFVKGTIPEDYFNRFIIAIFLLLSGGIIGIVSYYKDAAINTLKEWFPSSANESSGRPS
jgi:hypothetical protein